MRIAEKLIHITNDFKDCYIGEYGKIASWDGLSQDMYLLNCDAEIQNFLKEEDVEIHSDVFSIGISLGVLVIQKELMYKFTDRYGGNFDYEQKNEMYETIQSRIFDYITNGAFNAY
jgi:hypothetical protein